jgi:hypothetical protein
VLSQDLFDELTNQEVPTPTSASADLEQLLGELLNKDAELRLDATELVLHPWIEEVPPDRPTAGGS